MSDSVPKSPDSPRLKALPYELSEARRAELEDLDEFTRTTVSAVLAAVELFESVERLEQKGIMPVGTPVKELCRVWDDFLPPLIEVAQLEPYGQPYWHTLKAAREKLAGFNHRLIVWRDSKQREQTAEHWHDVVWYLAFRVVYALSTVADAHDVLVALQDKGVLREFSTTRILSELQRESTEALAVTKSEAGSPSLDAGVSSGGHEPPDEVAILKQAQASCELAQFLAWRAEQYAIHREGKFKSLPLTYGWLELNFEPFAEDVPIELRGYELPPEVTWKRQVGAVRTATGTNVNSPRTGRPHGGSVVKKTEL